jgi:hypothetical protein
VRLPHLVAKHNDFELARLGEAPCDLAHRLGRGLVPADEGVVQEKIWL